MISEKRNNSDEDGLGSSSMPVAAKLNLKVLQCVKKNSDPLSSQQVEPISPESLEKAAVNEDNIMINIKDSFYNTKLRPHEKDPGSPF